MNRSCAQADKQSGKKSESHTIVFWLITNFIMKHSFILHCFFLLGHGVFMDGYGGQHDVSSSSGVSACSDIPSDVLTRACYSVSGILMAIQWYAYIQIWVLLKKLGNTTIFYMLQLFNWTTIHNR